MLIKGYIKSNVNSSMHIKGMLKEYIKHFKNINNYIILY